MTKILITLLTSGKLNFLIESYKSIINQDTSDINYDVVIIVNTLNDSYYEEVNKLFKNVIRTESNGKPGKGHNSCVNYFKENTQYDYLIPIDGDDFVYPFFLKNLFNYIKYPYSPDILFLPFSDNITTTFKKCLYYPFKECYFNFNIDFLNCMNGVYKTKISPFIHALENINTPARLLLISRNALSINFSYDEKCKWYDDLLPFLQIFEISVLYPNKYNIYFVEDYYLHIYNSLNDNSATTNFLSNVKENYVEENNYFQESIKNKFLAIKDWDLKKIKVLSNSYNKSILNDKINFIQKLIINLELENMDNVNYDPEHLKLCHSELIKNNYESIYKINK